MGIPRPKIKNTGSAPKIHLGYLTLITPRQLGLSCPCWKFSTKNFQANNLKSAVKILIYYRTDCRVFIITVLRWIALHVHSSTQLFVDHNFMNTEILSQLVIPGSYANTLTYLGQIDSQNKHINRVQLIRGFSLALWYCYGLRTNLQSKKKRRWVVFRHLKIAAIQVTLACWTGLLDLLLFYYLLDSICLILLASGENFVCDVSPLHSTPVHYILHLVSCSSLHHSRWSS